MRLAVNILTPEVKRIPGLLAIQSPLEEVLPMLRDYGYDGIEFISTNPKAIDACHLDHIISANGFYPVGVNTGRIKGELGLSLSSPDDDIRIQAIMRTKDIIDFASFWGIPVNIGILRGTIKEGGGEVSTLERFLSSISVLVFYAEQKQIDLMLETVAHPMMDFINTLDEAAQIISKIGSSRLKVMYDFSQMELEETSLYCAIKKHMDIVRHIHFADTERKVPGEGKIDWNRVISILSEEKYKYDASIEVAPLPTEMAAAKASAEYMLPLMRAYGF